MKNKLERFESCFEAMLLKLSDEKIINHRGDVVGFFDQYGDFHSKDEHLVELVEGFLNFEEPKPVKPKRARKKDGTYKADDPSTPDVNEAWESIPSKDDK